MFHNFLAVLLFSYSTLVPKNSYFFLLLVPYKNPLVFLGAYRMHSCITLMINVNWPLILKLYTQPKLNKLSAYLSHEQVVCFIPYGVNFRK